MLRVVAGIAAAAEHQVVAGPLRFGLNPLQHQPHQRIEPVECRSRLHNDLRETVPSRNVPHFVQHHDLATVGGPGRKVFRQDQTGAEDAHGKRNGTPIRLDQREFSSHAEFPCRLLQQFYACPVRDPLAVPLHPPERQPREQDHGKNCDCAGDPNRRDPGGQQMQDLPRRRDCSGSRRRSGCCGTSVNRPRLAFVRTRFRFHSRMLVNGQIPHGRQRRSDGTVGDRSAIQAIGRREFRRPNWLVATPVAAGIGDLRRRNLLGDCHTVLHTQVAPRRKHVPRRHHRRQEREQEQADHRHQPHGMTRSSRRASHAQHQQPGQDQHHSPLDRRVRKDRQTARRPMFPHG